ncbi:hypothetical protein EVAR_71512_1 [Eumeta japonica]|uniref:Uncharacterized protein n=1 Tax=Eumeta variegata TaxID=151549 RepID=A0A4C2AAL6_EUMVA|nr:hypothetical protein EVAR_71512_1 [Eumeta japonica]
MLSLWDKLLLESKVGSNGVGALVELCLGFITGWDCIYAFCKKKLEYKFVMRIKNESLIGTVTRIDIETGTGSQSEMCWNQNWEKLRTEIGAEFTIVKTVLQAQHG